MFNVHRNESYKLLAKLYKKIPSPKKMVIDFTRYTHYLF